MFLLDTNVISELRKAGDGKANPNVVAWLSSVDSTTLYLSAITLMELEIGVGRLERRDPTQGARLRTWLETQILPEFSARIHIPDPRPLNDSLIAATAVAHGMTLITRNTADFTPTSVPLLNPWLA